MKDPHIKGRLVYEESDGSKVSIRGGQAWRHVTPRSSGGPSVVQHDGATSTPEE